MSKIGRTLILILLGIMLAAALIGMTAGTRMTLSFPEKVFKDVLTWTQDQLNKPARAVAGLFQDMSGMFQLYEENQVLKKSLEHYAQLAAENEELRAQNKRLKEMLDYQQKENNYTLKLARVVARDPDRWMNNVLVIDLGEKDGVRPNMAVITPRGVIGKVVQVSHSSANVQLITDVENGSRVSAVVQGPSRAIGVIDGYDAQQGTLILSKVPLEDAIEPGQRVVTSGFGGIFPPGLLIGTIESVQTGENGLSLEARVRPAADLVHLDEVFVIMGGMER
ncbi:MAG: rod shape-determining protein MreC [Bacillus thermozeamaize]|uniref:Cell shape-determining protein MreC n=1 Tax=Bacillus thermozeamaize TaxID=230954 RepID=A0A1Y3PIM3_9BACI|nr:MAG: rod shape-determining protein MreC [Bacillus thermozeamaize]